MFYIFSNLKLAPKNKFVIFEKKRKKIVLEEEAKIYFEKIKKSILKLINFAENNKYQEIDEIKYLWPLVKSKISYLYFPKKNINFNE